MVAAPAAVVMVPSFRLHHRTTPQEDRMKREQEGYRHARRGLASDGASKTWISLATVSDTTGTSATTVRGCWRPVRGVGDADSQRTQ